MFHRLFLSFVALAVFAVSPIFAAGPEGPPTAAAPIVGAADLMLAQVSSGGAPPQVVPLALPDPNLPPTVSNEVDALRSALAAYQGKRWLALLGAGLALLVHVMRRLFLSGVSWMQSDRWGWVLGVLVPACGGVIASLMTGPFSWQTLFDAAMTAAFAVLAYTTAKKGIASPAKT